MEMIPPNAQGCRNSQWKPSMYVQDLCAQNIAVGIKEMVEILAYLLMLKDSDGRINK